MPSVKKRSHSSRCYTTTDGEFFPLCALLSLHAKAFLAGARWNHHHNEHAWEEGCCMGLPEHLGSCCAENLTNKASLRQQGHIPKIPPADAAELEDEVVQLRATRRAAPIADLTLLLAGCWWHLPQITIWQQHHEPQMQKKKSKASTAASVEMLQLSMKAWRALN